MSLMAEQPKKKKKSYTILKVLVGIWAVGFVGILIEGSGSKTPTTASQGTKFHAMMAASSCEDLIKRNLKNPPSYKLVTKDLYADVVFVTYRATNGFGGVVTNRGTCDVDGDTVTLRS